MEYNLISSPQLYSEYPVVWPKKPKFEYPGLISTEARPNSLYKDFSWLYANSKIEEVVEAFLCNFCFIVPEEIQSCTPGRTSTRLLGKTDETSDSNGNSNILATLSNGSFAT